MRRGGTFSIASSSFSRHVGCHVIHARARHAARRHVTFDLLLMSDVEIDLNSLASFDAARVKDLFVLLPWLLPLRLGCSARRLGSAARHSSKAAWRLGSPARHGGALRQLATPRGDSARRPRRRAPLARLGSPAQRRGAAARRRSARRRGGVAAKRLARLGSAQRAATRPRGCSAALRLCGARRGGSAAALRRGGSAAWRGEHGAFGVSLFYLAFKKNPSPVNSTAN